MPNVLCSKRVFLSLVICSFLSSGVSEALADLQDDIDRSVVLDNENTKIVRRVGDFINKCIDERFSDVKTCDSLIQKYYIHLGKFLAENHLVMEQLIYPVTLPSRLYTFTGLDSKNVTGSNDRADAVEHISVMMRYEQIIQDFTRQCMNSAKLQDVGGIMSCNSLTASLNLHLKVFNQNANSEFEKILG